MTTHSNDLEQKKLKTLLKELANIRGRHTELVTVYIPADYNINKVADQLSAEKSTANNIKSKTTKKNVVAALDKVLAQLKFYTQTPPNGIAIFCGNVSKFEGAADIEMWVIEPPEPIKVRLYRCDQTFILEPLMDIYREKEIYAFILVDANDGCIGLLRGKRLEMLKKLDSLVPGKTAKGGWSQARYARVREGLLNDFLKEIAETAADKLKDMGDLRGIIIGGPGPVKEQFAKGDYLVYQLRDKVLGVIDTSYVDEHGLREALERSEDILKDASVVREKKILERFFTELAKDSGLIVYGLKETVQALESGSMDVLLISDDFDWAKVKIKCNCGKETNTVLRESLLEIYVCPGCGSKPEIVKEEELMNRIIKTAEDKGAQVEIISAESPSGEQFAGLGGIAGILRYKSGSY